MLYGSLFAWGCRIGLPALPFFFAAAVGIVASVLVVLSPQSVFSDGGVDRKAEGAKGDGDGQAKTIGA